MSTDLRDFLGQALADLDVPTDRLREGAMARGRGARRRRRAMASLGGVAVVALAAAVAVPSLAGTEVDDRVASDTGTPDPSPQPRPVKQSPGWWDMPGAAVRDRLAAQLPSGLRITDANLGDEDQPPGEKPPGGFVAIDVADQDGPAGGLNVILYPPVDDPTFARERLTCPGNYPPGPALECTEVPDATGESVGRDVRWARQGVVVLEVTRLTSDGAIVYVASSNSSDDKWGLGSAVDRAAPPVRLAGLGAIAEDPTWQDWTPPED